MEKGSNLPQSLVLSPSPVNDLAEEEADVLRALGEAAHEVGIPGVAEGGVDADGHATPGDLLTEILPHTVEELHLVRVAELSGDLRRAAEQHVVVGGDGRGAA